MRNHQLLLSKPHLSKVSAWLFIVACCLFSVGPSPANTAPPSESPSALTIFLGPYMDFSALFIAIEEGYFLEQGIQLQPIRLNRPTDAIPALLNNDLDIAPTIVSCATLNAVGKSSGSVKAVAAMGSISESLCSYASLVASPKNTDISAFTKHQLRNKKFQLRPASMQLFFLDKWLARYGLSSEDVQTTYMPKPAVGEALGKGALDFTVLTEPWLSRIVQAGQGEVVESFHTVLQNMQFSLILFGPSLLQDNTRLGQRFVNAYVKGIHQYQQGKTERNLDIMAKYTGMEKEFLRTVCWPVIHADGFIDFQGIDAFQHWALEKGYVDKVVQEETFWDPRFVENSALSIDPLPE